MMDFNFILVGLQNGAKLKGFLKSKDISFVECGSFKQFKPLLKKGFYNHVLLFERLSTEDHLIALRDVTLFGGQAVIHYASTSDEALTFDDTFSDKSRKIIPLSSSRDEFVNAFMPVIGQKPKEPE